MAPFMWVARRSHGIGSDEAGKACLLAAAACGLALSAPARAQQSAPGAAELDPSAPLDPMPDLGVDWPDMDQPDPLPEPEPGEPQEAQTGDQAAAESIEDSAEARRYAWQVEGLEGVEQAEALIDSFREQSDLEENEGEAANAAQIDRRARDDAELLTSLLESQGYYDAEVDARIGLAGEGIAVVLRANPGPRYSFASVELPGLESAGAEAGKLRDAFAVKAGDAVVAADVIAANVALKVALGEEGFAMAEIGEQDIVIDHETRTARLVLPVTTGPAARFGDIQVTGEPPFSPATSGRIARFRKGDMSSAPRSMICAGADRHRACRLATPKSCA